ncbi:v-type proton ATPase subunit e [Phtheirospermum japonicum]|uniref:V-type proton ATPase subunit e n=1 Tax=Phtheirospermum japonicum TaxID=374723 RepID=A0A830BF37_9LAMI|nr:v-type proton ATPase subunit e [Phtheirospermum japonicum]
MNDADVSKQIQQMVCFIRQETKEKANDISISVEEEFNIKKLQLVEAEKKNIGQKYERKEKQVQVYKVDVHSPYCDIFRLLIGSLLLFFFSEFTRPLLEAAFSPINFYIFHICSIASLCLVKPYTHTQTRIART